MLPSLKVIILASIPSVWLLGQSLVPADLESTSDPNINSRYTIESINFAGPREYKLSTSALEEIRRLVGAKASSEALDRLALRIRSDLRAHDVSFKLMRGAQPESVRVLINVDGAGASFDASIPVFSYNSALGFTGVGEVAGVLGVNALTVQALRDSDNFIEQLSGIQARYQRLALANGRVSLGFEFDAYQDQYSSATLTALATPPSSLGAGAYRSRLNYEPSATFVLAAPLSLTLGFSFEQLDRVPTLVRPESANAVISTLRYHRRWSNHADGIHPGDNTQQVDAGYSLRAASTTLGSDLAYTRHLAHVKYNYSNRTQSVEVSLIGGAIYGQAPLFERFALGDSTLLRGWNKYELDPLGGNRLAYGSVTYGYRVLRFFYDAGSVWEQGMSPQPKASAGIGIASGLGVLEKGAFLVALAFPIRQGRVTPELIAGMRFTRE